MHIYSLIFHKEYYLIQSFRNVKLKYNKNNEPSILIISKQMFLKRIDQYLLSEYANKCLW